MKQLAVTLLIISVLVGCGGNTVKQPIINPNDFPAAQQLTCSGTNGTGICDESDGSTYYKHYQWSIDGNTFQAIIELGVKKSANYQINFPFPFLANIKEAHTTEEIDNWCKKGETLGFESNFDGNDGITIKRMLASKGAHQKQTDAAFERITLPAQQVFFPDLAITGMTNNTFIDLCSQTTVHWTVVGTIGK